MINHFQLQKQAKAKRNESMQQCEKIVDSLIEILLKTEEKEPNLMKIIEGKRSVSENIVAVIKTFAMFCEAHPPFALKHISTLLPYLKVCTALTLYHRSRIKWFPFLVIWFLVPRFCSCNT